MSEEIESHILDGYEIIKKLGKGAYGVVWKGTDKRTNRSVAIKKIYDAFQNSTDAQRTYREVMYLDQLSGHDNIVKLLSVIRAQNNRDLYMVFELMESDLHLVIKSRILKYVHKQMIMHQLFKVLKYIHSADIVHRDLKPANILINSDCHIKLADFGLARSLAYDNSDECPIVSDYVATRWYRAPEILLGCQRYSKSVDMWSTGCILAELLLDKVLFAGKSSLNQLELIIELLGRPSETDIWDMKISHSKNLLSSINTKKSESMEGVFSSMPADAVDLLKRLLVFNPQKRITVDEALKHPYLARFHKPTEEVVCTKKIVVPIDDNEKCSTRVYRDAIYKKIQYASSQQRLLTTLSAKFPSLQDSKKLIQTNETDNSKINFSKYRLTSKDIQNSNKRASKENLQPVQDEPKAIFLYKGKTKSEDHSRFRIKGDLRNYKMTTKFSIPKIGGSKPSIFPASILNLPTKIINTSSQPKKTALTYSLNIFKMSSNSQANKNAGREKMRQDSNLQL